MDAAPSTEIDFSGNTFVIRPNFKHKFRPVAVREVISTVLSQNLTDKTYNSEEVPDLTRNLAEKIKEAVKDLGYDRYRLMVQVCISLLAKKVVAPGQTVLLFEKHLLLIAAIAEAIIGLLLVFFAIQRIWIVLGRCL